MSEDPTYDAPDPEGWTASGRRGDFWRLCAICRRPMPVARLTKDRGKWVCGRCIDPVSPGERREGAKRALENAKRGEKRRFKP